MKIDIPDSLYDERYEAGFKEAENAFKWWFFKRIWYDFMFFIFGIFVWVILWAWVKIFLH